MHVAESDDLHRLHVDGGGARVAVVDAALKASGLGAIAPGGDAEISVEALRAAAQSLPRSDDWDDRWLVMLNYAESKGWLSGDGKVLTAHIVDAHD